MLNRVNETLTKIDQGTHLSTTAGASDGRVFVEAFGKALNEKLAARRAKEIEIKFIRAKIEEMGGIM